MKRKLSFRKGADGDLEIFWCGSNVSGESWGAIMKMVLKGKERSGVTLVESVMTEAFPGLPPALSDKDLNANKSAEDPDYSSALNFRDEDE